MSEAWQRILSDEQKGSEDYTASSAAGTINSKNA
jgi:hypothetical protein